MLSRTDIGELLGATVYGHDGSRLGIIRSIHTGSDNVPTFIRLASHCTDAAGSVAEVLVPAEGAQRNCETVIVSCTAAKVAEAPFRGLADDEFDEAQAQELFRYWGMSAYYGSA
jgi:hypothetical protein